MNQNIKHKIMLFWKGWGVSIAVAVLIATSFKSAVAELNLVPTGSMKPTILEGDRILVNKLAYDLKFPYTTFHIVQWADPHRGDIIVFYSPADGTRLVKRVIGMPGEQIAMHDNRLFINGLPFSYETFSSKEKGELPPTLTEDHQFFSEHTDGTTHAVMITPGHYAIRSFPPVTIPAGHYFVMGDNRDNSADSRYFGFVSRDSILGKAPSIVYSLDSDEHYLPRTDRFFKPLT